jgi:flagella basal body P-ring formation protein FlgA
MMPGGKPGGTSGLDRRLVLRKLVQAGLAAGVRISGAQVCQIHFTGKAVNNGALADSLGQALRKWLPAGSTDSPPSWCEVELPERDWVFGAPWRVSLVDPKPLKSGRNLVAVRVSDGSKTLRLTATVHCHVFGEVARSRQLIEPQSVLRPEMFIWEWQDLSQIDRSLVVGRQQLTGMSTRRRVQLGELLRTVDLKPTPLVRRGQPVELVLQRGLVTVTARGIARQEGRRGQIVTVRNEVNGKLVTGRVVGPGVVAWGR